MMARVPVVATVRDAYTFTINHLGGIIGLIWVPMLLLTVMGFFSLHRYYSDFIEAMSGGSTAALGPSMLMMIGYLIAALLMQAIMYVAVVQLALGQRTAPAVAHFAFGPAEWRMFRAFLAFVGLLLALIIPVFVIGSAALGTTGVRAYQMLMLVLVVYGIILLSMPRFLMLLPAIAVGETVPVLRRSWQLSSGNFGRLLLVLIAVFGPVLIIFGLLEMVLASQVPAAAPGATEKMQMVAAVTRARQMLPYMSGLAFLIYPLIIGLFAGASVSAWRTLKDEPSVIAEA
jgi:hypothetical protein